MATVIILLWIEARRASPPLPRRDTVSDPKRAFDVAFTAGCEAGDFETAEIHLGHAMDELYRLYELAKRSRSRADKDARDHDLVKTGDGKIAGAVIWARKYRTHDSGCR
jgi:hypothetical protein